MKRSYALVLLMAGTCEFAGAQILPAPTLLSPSNNAINQPTSPILRWTTVLGTTTYNLQVSLDSLFTAVVYEDSTIPGNSTSVPGLLNATTYYWKVRSLTLILAGEWSSAWRFTTVATAPPPPVLLSPTDGATGVSTSLTCSWATSAGATSYHLQASTTSTFKFPAVDDSGITGTSLPVQGLQNGAAYYWRVNSSNAGGTSAWSSVWSFTTIVAAPAAPVLSLPANGATGQATTLTLSWNSSSGAASYRVQVSSGAAFQSLLLDDSTVTGTSRQVTSLANGTTYYWRVSAKNAGGVSAWSSVRSFATIVSGPSAFSLSSPSNGATNQSLTGTFVWQSSSVDARYDVYLDQNNPPATVVSSNQAVTSYVYRVPANGTTYYWSVTARNAGGSTAATGAPWSFTTIAGVVTQRITVAQGWNMISSFIQPPSLNLDSMCAAIKANMVLLKNGAGQVYWPAYGINAIGNWNSRDGYQLYMRSADTLPVTGAELLPGASPISLVQGWNMVGYVRSAPLRADSCLASIAADLVLAKNNAGQVYWPSYGINTMGGMNPGQGYQLYMTRASVLTYPDNAPGLPPPGAAGTGNSTDRRGFGLSGSGSEAVVHFSFTSNTGNNATVAVPVAANPNIGGTTLIAGDEIGAFTPAGLCAGAIVWSDTNAALTVWGDNDQTPGIDGLRAGEQIYYRLWRQSSNTEYQNVAVTYATGTGAFQANGIFVLSSLTANQTAKVEDTKGLPAQFSLGQNYPNPFNPSTTIEYGLPLRARVTLEVYDVAGNRVSVLVNESQPAGFHRVAFQGSGLQSGTYIYRLKASTFVSVRKMLVLR